MMHIQNFIQWSFDCFGIFSFGNKNKVDQHSQNEEVFLFYQQESFVMGNNFKNYLRRWD